MAQDLRKLFKEQREEETYQMKEGHADRFFSKLETQLPEKSKPSSYFWLKIAASVIVMIGLASYFFMNANDAIETKTTIVDNSNNTETNISLGDLSPDLEKIESYYVANINLELANLEISDDNKDIVDSYMEQLAALDLEYKKLNKELNDFGPNDQTIEALIQNLQLRLQLLKKLKEKLNQLKLSKNEQATII
jgi:cytoskeletal protein RodZ